jgi:hypothetical protein
VDAKKYGLTLRPLFFRKEYEAAPVQTKEFSYDVSFIGTAHSIRPYVVNRIDEALRAVGRKCFRFLYLPHPIVFIYNKLLNRDYRTVRKSDIQFTPMQAEEIRRVYDTSRCILDVEHPAQWGLTMRTIEMVGMNKKLITTNAGIADYDFYHPNNICIIDRKSPVIPEEFFTTPYVEIPHEILNRYSLKSFVRDIFGIHEQP